MKTSSIKKYVGILKKYQSKLIIEPIPTAHFLFTFFYEGGDDGFIKVKGATKAEHYSKMMQIYNRIYGLKHFVPTPALTLEEKCQKRRKMVLSTCTLNKCLKKLRKKGKDFVDTAMMWDCLWHLCLRPSELVLLRVEDIINDGEPGKSENIVAKIHCVKSNSLKYNIISPAFHKRLSEYITNRGEIEVTERKFQEITLKGQFIFKATNPEAITRAFHKANKKVFNRDKNHILPKDIRTSAATYLVNKEGSQIAARALGHASSSTTMNHYYGGGLEAKNPENDQKALASAVAGLVNVINKQYPSAISQPKREAQADPKLVIKDCASENVDNPEEQ